MSLLEYNERYRGLPQKLLNALLSGQLGQSYIFSGDSIDELNSFANSWMTSIVCREISAEGACGSCRNCKLMASSNYSELYTLEPASKSRTILVKELREFQKRFFYKSDSSIKKIGIIIEADRMQVAAQNAFLKTLEEPPVDTVFILLTTRVDALLNTIKSRCRLVSLVENKVSYDQSLSSMLMPLLTKLKGKDGAGAALAVSDEVKSIFTSLRKKAQFEIECLADEMTIDEDDISQRKKLKEKIVVMTEGRYKLYREQVLSLLEVWMSQNFLISSGVEASQLAHPEYLSSKWVLTVAEAENSLRYIEMLRQDLMGNVNEDLALENFFLQICQK